MFCKLSTILFAVIFIFWFAILIKCEPPPKLHLEYQWSQLEFDYTNVQERQRDIDNKIFVPGVATPIDLDVHYYYGQRFVFVTIPRFRLGMPVTLGIVTNRTYEKNPIIQPYPSWSWHRNPESCPKNRLVSVYRVAIDECNRLWVLDTGRFGANQTCPPQIVAFDLKTKKLVHRYEIPSSLIKPESILVNLLIHVLDTRHYCKNTFIYIADCQGNAIIVYDAVLGTSWKILDKTLNPDPNYRTFTILGDSFDLEDGVLGMALSPDRKKIFYHAMTSGTEHWVYTADLRNRKRFEKSPASSPEIFHTYKQGRGTQCAAESIDKNGISFFGLISNVTLNCWNTHTEYGPDNIQIILDDQETMQFASGVKVVSYWGTQKLWVLTSRIQKVWNGIISTSEINFRIQAGHVERLISGTTCASTGSN